jgi:acyl-CoA synthetase
VPSGFRNVVDPSAATRFREQGWWGDVTVADLVARNATANPSGHAFVSPEGVLSWVRYRDVSDRLAAVLIGAGLEPGERVALLLEDGPTMHAVFVGNEKAGLITVGIGARAGDLEIRHLIERTGAVALISHARHRRVDTSELYARLVHSGLPLRRHIVVPRFEVAADGDEVLVNGAVADADVVAATLLVEERRMGPDDFFLINSTSGTTGLPKCVMHTQNSKMYMAGQARVVGDLGPSEVVFGGAPMPFGFGLFTTHFVPLVLGGTAVVASRFDADQAIEMMERERVTVLVCVSTQFKMLLNSPEIRRRDWSALRIMFTGGEMIPFAAAREFEDLTGASVLNFYGSNESGMCTGTRLSHSRDHRLRTGGTYLDGTEVRLFDEGVDVTSTGRGQPGSRGPAACLGYYDDPAANEELFTDDGFVLHADICTIDNEGFLSVVGRKSDIIIRGGKNISAAVVEDAVSEHPAVALASAVPMPDPLFGERVCVYVELRPGQKLTIEELVAFLDERGGSKETFPEHLVIVDRIARSSGSKIAKGTLREDARRRAAEMSGPEVRS